MAIHFLVTLFLGKSANVPCTYAGWLEQPVTASSTSEPGGVGPCLNENSFLPNTRSFAGQ